MADAAAAEGAVGTEVSRRPLLFVLQTGIITTALALGGVYWLNGHSEDFQIMGWYADYVIPVGAILVGAVAGSGYAIASWFTGLRISRWLLLAVLVLQASAYLAAEYIEYSDTRKSLEQKGLVLSETGKLPTFFEYYNVKARSWAWKGQHDKEPGGPLGGWGYVFLLLGAAGFIASGLIAPAALLAMPYCQECQRYMTRKTVGMLPASVPYRKIKKADTAGLEGYAAEQSQAAAAADEILKRLAEAATVSNAEGFRQELAATAPDRKAIEKLPRRVQVVLVWCKACQTGHVLPIILSGQGKQLKQTKLPPVPVSRDFVAAMQG